MPRLNMRDKRPANRLSLAGWGWGVEATANRHCPFLSMNWGFSPLRGQAPSKQWCHPELWKSSCLNVLIGALNGPDQRYRGPEIFCFFPRPLVHIVLGFGPKPNMHRSDVMFDLARSGFYLVGIQRFGFERSSKSLRCLFVIYPDATSGLVLHHVNGSKWE